MMKRVLTTLALCILLAGCAAMNVQNEHASLFTRVKGLMDARIDGDWEKIYGYYWSGFRDEVAKKDFLSTDRGITFTNYTIGKMEIHPSGRSAEVWVKLTRTIQGFEFTDRMHPEPWVKEGGTWYYQAKKPGPPLQLEMK